MSIHPSTPWHKASYDRFLSDRLPQLLSDRLPLAGYEVEEDSPHTCSIWVELSGGVRAVYPAIPRPDDTGVFTLQGEPFIVIPTASNEELESAEVACVGEQLYSFIQDRLGRMVNGLAWDEGALRTWAPLDGWVNEFMESRAQRLDGTNWLSRHTHLRRILISNRQKVIAPGQMGRVCPYETPESANLGRVFTVAVGAEIRDGKLLIVDDRPEAGLGLSASMLPFLEHNDPNRLLMAANFQRQCLPAPDPEPALVQTGCEPDAPDFWCGRNLLTAFLSLGEATTQDAIVISASAARKLNFPRPIEPGDKLTNRHGIKGVVSQIRPDAEMPHLKDGTPVELVYLSFGLPTRLTFGPVREALAGRIAHTEGQPVIAPPFKAPKEDELLASLRRLGLDESGQELLSQGKDGPRSEQQTTVGWVYWNRSTQMAQEKMAASAAESVGLAFSELEFQALMTAGAVENLKEAFNIRSARRKDGIGVAAQLSKGNVEPPPPPSPWLDELSRRLRAAGIAAQLDGGKLAFRFETPQGKVLELAKPIADPWLRERQIDRVGAWEGEAFELLAQANERLQRMHASRAPESLRKSAEDQLSARLEAYFESLLPPESLSFGQQVFLPDEPGFGEPQLFSAKAVAAPGSGLSPDQVGLPDEIAWTLFSPLVIRALGEAGPVHNRTAEAERALDEALGRSWVIVHRPPAVEPTSLLAFRPVRTPGRVIRLHPLACGLLNADFDGDQLAVYLPITSAAQEEAGAKMTMAAHLRRDPGLASALLPHPEVIWGLAWRSLVPAGKSDIADLLGAAPADLPAPLSQPVLFELVEGLFRREDPSQALERVHRLTQLGYRTAEEAGASISPFLGSGISLPPMPEGNDPEAWRAYAEEMAEAILADTDYHDPRLGPQLLAAKIRSRNRRTLPMLIGPRGLVQDAGEGFAVVRHRLVDGLPPADVYNLVPGARRGLAELLVQVEKSTRVEAERGEKAGWTVLARARRSSRPGIVFARAAASREVDPLSDFTSRLLVGLV